MSISELVTEFRAKVTANVFNQCIAQALIRQ